MTKIKLMDLVFNPNNNLKGQIIRIRHGVATIVFQTGDKIKKEIKSIEWNGTNWQIRK